MLVPRDSAQDSGPPGVENYYVAIDQNHADLPKFSDRHDSNYRLLRGYMEDMWRDAEVSIQLRFGTRRGY